MKTIKLILVGMMVALIATGCATTKTLTASNSGVSLTGTASVPSGATYAKSFKEKTFYALNYVLGGIAEALPGQNPWSGATISVHKPGDYPLELLNTGVASVVTDANGNYNLPDVVTGFYIAKANKNSTNLYSLVYPGLVSTANITAESTATAYLVASLAQLVNFDIVNASYINAFKSKVETLVAASFNANVTLVPDFSNSTDVATKIGTMLSNNLLFGALTEFDAIWNDYLSKTTRYQITTENISTYGTTADTAWNSVVTFKNCRNGNDKYGMPGGDLVTVKLAKDSTYLYVYAKMRNAITTTTGRYEFSLVLLPNYGVGTNYAWRTKFNGSAWNTTIASGAVAASSNVGNDFIEMRIPLASITSLSSSASNYPTIEVGIIDNNNLPVVSQPYLFYSDYVAGIAKI